MIPTQTHHTRIRIANSQLGYATFQPRINEEAHLSTSVRIEDSSLRRWPASTDTQPLHDNDNHSHLKVKPSKQQTAIGSVMIDRIAHADIDGLDTERRVLMAFIAILCHL